MSEESKLLGKRIDYPKSYCPEILVAVPRSLNREIYGINQPEKLFCGFDSWHAYEVSCILNNGMPIAGLFKIVYPSTSPYIVESKSLKLYLSSYNMTRLGTTPQEAILNLIYTVEKDLSQALSTEVKACFYQHSSTTLPFDFSEYENLENNTSPEKITFSVYQEHPEYLNEKIQKEQKEMKICSHLLKSNCKITNQPDWGSIYIHLKGERLPHKESILKYIVSLRNENHFHEEICEMTYKRLYDLFAPEILMVSCLYTRRGGIDICPCRANHPEHLPFYLPQANILTQRSFRQ